MSRPRKIGVDYFPHDTSATNNEKIEVMRNLYGNDGYAFYFILLERIYRTENGELDISNQAIRLTLIKKLMVDEEKFEQMLKTAFEINLFDRQAYQERKVLTSSSIKKRIEEIHKMRSKEREKKVKGGLKENNTVVFPRENVGENIEKNQGKLRENTEEILGKQEENPERAEKQASERSAPKPENQSPQNDKDINIFDNNNNNTNTLNNNQENLEVLKDNKLTNVNTEVGLKLQETTGEDVNNSPPVVNNKQLIADLVKRFEEITDKHDKKLYPLLGQLYNDYGYAEVLWALDRLEWGLKNKKIENPEGYLINVLKNSKKESGNNGKHKKDSRKYGELPPDDPYSIIKPIRLGKQPDLDVDPYASIPVIRLGPGSTS